MCDDPKHRLATEFGSRVGVPEFEHPRGEWFAQPPPRELAVDEGDDESALGQSPVQNFTRSGCEVGASGRLRMNRTENRVGFSRGQFGIRRYSHTSAPIATISEAGIQNAVTPVLSVRIEESWANATTSNTGATTHLSSVMKCEIKKIAPTASVR